MMEVDDETSANLVSKRRDFAFNGRRDSRRGTSNEDGDDRGRTALRLRATAHGSPPEAEAPNRVIPMGILSQIASQVVITGVLIGVARRAGVITLNPRAIKGETARKAFEVYVSTAEWAVKKAEDVLLSSAKSLTSK